MSSSSLIIGGIVSVVVIAAIITTVVIIAETTPVYVVIQSANTKENWMNAMATEFNNAGFTTEAGKAMFVRIEHTGSTLKPDKMPAAWSPGIGSWIGITNGEYGEQLIKDTDCPATVQIPIGIAMWKPMAETLGWPNADITWEEIADLANDNDGWSLYNGTWGKFKYGHGHPEFSNSGRLSIVAQVHAYTGKTGYLSTADVNSVATTTGVAALQKSIVHYGRLDTDLLDRMTSRGPEYLHAVTTYESNVIRWNEEKNLIFPFVLVYPKDGIFWNDHPICILDGEKATWNTPHDIEVAKKFQEFILTDESQKATVKHGVRPASTAIDIESIPGSKITMENGVISSFNIETIPSLPLPDESITQSIIDMWKINKKPATMVMIIDTSGSMSGDKIRSAKSGAKNFVRQLNSKDDLILYEFNSDVTRLNQDDRTNVGQNRNYLINEIDYLYAGGSTALYDATETGIEFINQRKQSDIARDYSSTYGIILLSDGEDTASFISQSSLFNSLPSSEDSSGVHVYSIAYGDGVGSASTFLQTISQRTNGLYFESDETNIEEIYVYITSEF